LYRRSLGPRKAAGDHQDFMVNQAFTPMTRSGFEPSGAVFADRSKHRHGASDDILAAL
jgi:hypothetical protein